MFTSTPEKALDRLHPDPRHSLDQRSQSLLRSDSYLSEYGDEETGLLDGRRGVTAPASPLSPSSSKSRWKSIATLPSNARALFSPVLPSPPRAHSAPAHHFTALTRATDFLHSRRRRQGQRQRQQSICSDEGHPIIYTCDSSSRSCFAAALKVRMLVSCLFVFCTSTNQVKRKISLASILVFSILFLNLVIELAAFNPDHLIQQLPLPLRLELEQAMVVSALNDETYNATAEFPIVYATSHNDEMQAAPFTEALSHGIPCIEVDVWLMEGVLLAGHESKDLSAGKTLDKLYLGPLMRMLNKANPEGIATLGEEPERNAWTGIFPLAPEQEFMLMIDMKADGEEIWPHLLDALQPFLDKKYLTYYDAATHKLHRGPVQIVGTGNTPIPKVFQMSPQRYIFYDAPLVTLKEGIIVDGEKREWDDTVAPIASSKWLWTSYYPNVSALSTYSEEAHKRGIKARWWGVLRYPAYFRRALWNLQLKARVDWINADDLADVASFLRARMKEKRIVENSSAFIQQTLAGHLPQG